MKYGIDSIVVITPNYPHPLTPVRGTFVEALVREWQNLGVKTSVIAPIRVAHLLNVLKIKQSSLKSPSELVISPYYLTLSNRNMLNIDFKHFARRSFVNASIRASRKFQRPTIYYGKFLLHGGAAAALVGEMHNTPSFVDLGESRLYDILKKSEIEYASMIINKFTGIFCVSEKLQNEAIKLGADPEKIVLAPNSIDSKRFRPIDKKYCRNTLGLPQDAFIVSFTGSFIERKGPLRVLEAINNCPQNIYGVFLGEGKQMPCGERVLKAGIVPNEELPLWLNASDLFVLPTLAEGHCNAINEAIACSIPVIGSDIADIRKQIPAKVGVLVDPQEINSITERIEELYNNKEKLQSLKHGCLEHSSEIFKYKRGEQILKKLTQMIGNEK